VIYSSKEGPIAVARGAKPTASVKDLISDPMGFYAPVTPFLVVPVSDYLGKVSSVVGLAPPGCAVEHSSKAGFTADGTWQRIYESEPTGDYITREGRMANQLWRVSCDGKVREVRTADEYLDSTGVGDDDPSAMYARVVGYAGTGPGKAETQWRGRIAGLKPEVTLTSARPVPGLAMLAIGGFPKAVMATDLPEQVPVPTATGGDEGWAMISLGVAVDGITAVRMPEMRGERPVLGDRVFVYTDTDATRVEAVDPKMRVVATAAVSKGMAILSFDPGDAEEIRAVTSRDTPTASARFVEPASGSRLLGDQLFRNW
jgi:hypothetical protein